MAQQQLQGRLQTRTALLIFCKDMAQPLVLYFENSQKVYEELKKLIGSNETKMLEFEPLGPIKNAALLSSSIVSVALQEEKYMVKE